LLDVSNLICEDETNPAFGSTISTRRSLSTGWRRAHRPVEKWNSTATSPATRSLGHLLSANRLSRLLSVLVSG